MELEAGLYLNAFLLFVTLTMFTSVIGGAAYFFIKRTNDNEKKDNK